MHLSLTEHPDGVGPGLANRVVYDLADGEARAGAAATCTGRALVWELAAEPRPGALLTAPVEAGPGWVMRCDRIDFPPGGIAYRHTHPGPGIRYLLFGTLKIETPSHTRKYGAGEPWFESGPEPVLATAADRGETAFVRVLLLPGEWAGKRTIRYVDPADEEKPKLQRPTVFLEHPVAP